MEGSAARLSWTLGPVRRGAAAALGNFDGVHRGHAALIDAAGVAARDLGAPLGAVTFDPHPRRLFQPDAAPFLLTTPAARARHLAAQGVVALSVLRFDAAMAGLEPEAFVAQVLGDSLGLRHLVVGADFRFGRARRGDAALLARLGPAQGFGVTVLDLAAGPDGIFSSSAIRRALAAGDCAGAAAALGRWPGPSGPVIRGDQRGRLLGYPTANLDFGDQIVPAYGVYAAWVEVLDGPYRGRHAGVASIGVRPMFGVNAPNFEVHLFDFAGDLYGAEIEVGLVARLRGEAVFVDVPTLIAQMDRDSAQARAVLAAQGAPG